MRDYRELENNHSVEEINKILKDFNKRSKNPQLKELTHHILNLIITVSSYEMERQGYDRQYNKVRNKLIYAIKDLEEAKEEIRNKDKILERYIR